MRVLLLALMIALLPIRGWMGNAMAVSMAAQQVTMAASDAASDAMPDDCPMQMQAAAGGASGGVSAEASAPDGPAPAGDTAHCSCDTCELCLALASVAAFQMPRVSFAPAAGPMADGLLYVSADRATGLKPPIS